jgi:hypothetical protein
LPTDFSRALTTAEEPLVRFKTTHSAFGTFFQDQWQASPKLTMNYGLRYDVSHYQNILDVKPDNNDFQPRIGVAYAVSPKIVLRAGAGIFADASRRAPIGGLQAQAANFGFPDTGATPASLATTSAYSNAPSNGSQFFVAGAGPATAAARNFLSTGQFPSTTGALVLVVKYNKKQPTTYANQLSGEASFQLTKDLGLSLGYLFVGTHFLPTFARNLNAKPSGVNIAGQQLFAGRIDPRYLFVGSFAKTSNSVYHGGTAVLQKRFSRNFSVDVNYTYSKSIDDCGQCFFDNFSDAAVNPFNQSLERAISNQHVAHRFVSTFLVQSPQSWKNPIAKDFEFGGVIKLESPRYFTIYAGADANGDGNPLNDRLGLLGRNTLKGDNFRQVDIRLSRTFPLREKMRLKVLFDVANLFNTENINTINSVWGSFNPAVPPIASFKTPRTVFPARQIQYGLKLNF